MLIKGHLTHQRLLDAKYLVKNYKKNVKDKIRCTNDPLHQVTGAQVTWRYTSERLFEVVRGHLRMIT